jgi:hypothetical protein
MIPKISQKKEPKEKCNYMQVGRIIECGNCCPEKYADCKDIFKETGLKCNCICHDKLKEKCDCICHKVNTKCWCRCCGRDDFEEKDIWQEFDDKFFTDDKDFIVRTITSKELKSWIKQNFIEKKEVEQLKRDHEILISTIINSPMGASQWRNHGEKYGYFDYFGYVKRKSNLDAEISFEEAVDKEIDKFKKSLIEELENIVKNHAGKTPQQAIQYIINKLKK